MATSTIPLAKGLDLSKMEWPALISEKLDGVPIKITLTKHVTRSAEYTLEGRSGKHLGGPATDVAHFVDAVWPHLEEGKHVFVFETTHESYKAFKDISGIVNRREPQSGLFYNLFDYWAEDWAYEDTFQNRICAGSDLVLDADLPNFDFILQYPAMSEDAANIILQEMSEANPEAEGFIVASAERKFKPNSRHWDYQKVVVDPIHDLRLHSYDQALSKDGEPLGMVGRIHVWYNGQVTGCGPGKLTHAERIAEWDKHGDLDQSELNRIVAVKSKRDPSYSMLRQPTFQHFRLDKDEPNEDN